ncbi:MAG: Sir2 family NAD-dependent protein deacetylase [Lentisphaeria bacterium]|jgi:NAD-dependent deacetylase|nr:Sir2 family NAD-dependent protein deacetylase [Lentisphaeria bacterium]
MSYNACFDLIKHASIVTVLTGAGVSTLSGIPDFKGKNGVFHSNWQGFPVQHLLDITFFKQQPEVFYRYAAECLYPMLEKAPSIAHQTLAALQKKRVVDTIYTQNIDCLHGKAGAEDVVELHGSMRGHLCTHCGKSFALPLVLDKISGGMAPRCDECTALIKPDVVFYGETLNEKRLSRAFHDFAKSAVIIVMGSSLTVPPVSTLPMQTRIGGGKIIIVNEQETVYDQHAAWRFPDIEEFCQMLSRYMDA